MAEETKFEESFLDFSNIPSSMDELLQSSESTNAFTKGKIVEGKIVAKRPDGALVDIGYKAEGFVPASEFLKFDEANIGDKIDVYLEEIENRNNMPEISLEKAYSIKAWNRITTEYGEGHVVKGFMRHRVKGGIMVDVEGFPAFLPGSQLDVGPVHNMDDYIGKEFDVKIIKINLDRRNIVVSRRELLEETLKDQRSKLLGEMKVDELRKGVVKNITDFGAFIDLGGVDGLLHITDISWGRISHPSEVLKVGEEIEVVIIGIDKEKERVSLGLKQKTRNPWDDVVSKYPKGSKINGKVVNIMPYGAFVEIETGVEGLIHVSEMSWTRKINNPNEVLKPGQEVEAIILDINPEQQRISLGLKQAETDPWANINDLYKVGDVVKGKVTKIAAFGAFVELTNKIDGLIHISQLSRDRVEKVKDVLNVGDEVEARVIKVDTDERRIGLSIKAVGENFSPEDLKAAEEEYTAALKPGEAMVDMGEVFSSESLAGLKLD